MKTAMKKASYLAAAAVCATALLAPCSGIFAQNTARDTVFAETDTQTEWLLNADFSQVDAIPDAFDQTVVGFSRAELEEGALRMTVINGGSNDHVFFTYDFGKPLQGQITVETKMRTDSLPFANALFFFREGTEDFYATSSVVTNVAIEKGYFKNNSGSGWNATQLTCETGAWHDVRMVLDIDAGVYQLTVDGETQTGIPFRREVTSEADAVRYLRFGSQTAWADVSYQYIRVREAVESDFVDPVTFDYTNGFDGTTCPSDIQTSQTNGGSADFSTAGSVTLSTPTSGTVSVSKKFEQDMEGVIEAQVRFSNNSSAANTFANVLFLKTSRLSGTGAYVVTFAVESGCLRYHTGSKWEEVEYDGGYVYLVDNAFYTLRAVCDFSVQKTKLYLSGETYRKSSGGEQVALGEDVYLGEFDFRNKNIGNPDTFECAIGTGKALTSFTVDSISVKTVV